jgi:lipoprotein-anchoring transpeptidase ErfK/SrfK
MLLVLLIKNKWLMRFTLSFYLILLSVSCNNNLKNSEAKPASDLTEIKKAEEEQKFVITYHLDTIRNDSALKVFKATYSENQQNIIAAINRMDVWRIRVKKALVIPDTLLTDFINYSPFPSKLPIADTIEKIILVSLRTQLIAAYENGNLVRFGPTSTGKKSTPSPSGLFYTNFKSKLKTSTVDGQWRMPWYFNISNYGGIGMHQYALPGYPASHSCIRLYEKDAKWIFDWAKQWVLNEDGTAIMERGTPVIVFGKYNPEEPVPWIQLSENPNALDITDGEWTEINGHISAIKK